MKPFAFLETQERRFVYALIAMVVVLLVGHVLAVLLAKYSWQLERAFDLDREGNVPTWFSSFLWILVSINAYRCGQKSPVNRERGFWFVVAFVFILFSVDEVASFHENLSMMIRNRLLKGFFKGKFLGPALWPVFFGPFVAVLVTWLVIELRSSLRNARMATRYFLIGLGLFLFGGVVIELISNLTINSPGLQHGPLYQLEVMVEEGSEMMGAIIILIGLFSFERNLTHEADQKLAGMNVSASDNVLNRRR
ncbi:MAG: hypothetical protein HYS55_00510 [Candidatus Omnitrophica bacterium]|nr:hypothetical protein [Candidatus Omnitrophota bacterium]